MIEVHMKTLKLNRPLDFCFYRVGFLFPVFVRQPEIEGNHTIMS